MRSSLASPYSRNRSQKIRSSDLEISHHRSTGHQLALTSTSSLGDREEPVDGDGNLSSETRKSCGGAARAHHELSGSRGETQGETKETKRQKPGARNEAEIDSAGQNGSKTTKTECNLSRGNRRAERTPDRPGALPAGQKTRANIEHGHRMGIAAGWEKKRKSYVKQILVLRSRQRPAA
jgi:hypothetical protein